MIILRADQVTAMRKPLVDKFAAEMMTHLRQFSPEHSAGIGEANLAEVVRIGLGRAFSCHFTLRGPAQFYLELMFLFGGQFETDPQMPPTITGLLHAGSAADQMIRARWLHRYTVDYLNAVAGPGDAHARAALQNFQSLIQAPLPLAAEADLETQMLGIMRAAYPQRCDYVGDVPLRTVIAKGAETAGRIGLDPLRGAALCGLLMFELGHGCFDDPLFPWLSRAAGALTGEDPLDRTAQLERKAAAYLNLILRRLGDG